MYQFIIFFIMIRTRVSQNIYRTSDFSTMPYISSKGGKPDDVLGICLRAKRVGFSSTSQSKGFSSDSLTKVFCIVWLHLSTSPCDWGCKGAESFCSTPNIFIVSCIESEIGILPLCHSITLGIPTLEKMSNSASATFSVLVLFSGIASGHLVEKSTKVSM